MPEVLAVRNARAAVSLAPGRTLIRSVRRTEWILAGFLLYAAAAACVLPVSAPVRLVTMATNLAILLDYMALVYADSCRGGTLGIVRDWAPLALILLAYREMGWFALPQYNHVLEAHWVVWDRVFLRGGAKALIEVFGPVLPSVLEIAYSLVYVLGPFSVAMLYIYGCRDGVDRFLCVFSAGVLLCYAQFPLWPSEPPRVLFFEDDFPAYDTIFRCFNWWMLDKCGIHTGVFPSAHVAGAFAAAFGIRHVMPERRWVVRLLFTMAVLIAVATVYGRYHYLADATGGFLVAAFASRIAGRWRTSPRGRPKVSPSHMRFPCARIYAETGCFTVAARLATLKQSKGRL